MTTKFSLDRVTVRTDSGDVEYTFASSLTVLAGPTGVGKTTLLEAIKFGLGGNGRLTPVITDHVSEVVIDLSIGSERYRLARNIERRRQGIVRVWDLIDQQRLLDHAVDRMAPGGRPWLSALLMRALGLPVDVRAAPRSQSSLSSGDILSFNDVFSFMYVGQYEINRDIAGSNDTYREPKRKAVFELLFGLTDLELLGLRARRNELRAEVQRMTADHTLVLNFLNDSQTAGPIETDMAIAKAEEDARFALKAQARLRDEIEPVYDSEIQLLRDLLAQTEAELATGRAQLTSLVREQAEYGAERIRVSADLERLSRLQSAGERLAAFEFIHCPRCMQSVGNRPTPGGACRLCLQPDPVAPLDPAVDSYEERQLREQLAEMDQQMAALDGQLDRTNELLVERDRLIRKLADQIELRTAERVTPRMEAYSQAAARIATARAELTRLEGVRRQWDLAQDFAEKRDARDSERQRVSNEIDRRTQALKEYRDSLISKLSEEFEQTVLRMGVPGVETARINPQSYLPMLNDLPYGDLSLGGGVITATQVAYWTSVLSVALGEHVPLYPSFLMVDSPRLALNSAEQLAAALYRRLTTLAETYPEKLQIIVADNELPPAYRASHTEIDFSYDDPTVATIAHPGPASVETIQD